MTPASLLPINYVVANHISLLWKLVEMDSPLLRKRFSVLPTQTFYRLSYFWISVSKIQF